jgi:cathepsin A (carboxypeptidase C)
MQVRQKMEARNALRTLIKSIILVDAVLDSTTSGTAGYYGHLCTRDSHGNLKAGGFNETACRAMEVDTPACESLTRKCVDSYDRYLCNYAVKFCDETLGKWLIGDAVLGGRNSYDGRKTCKINPPLCEDILGGLLDIYMNQKHVQEALGFDNFNFSTISSDINSRFGQSGDTAMPTTRELSFILDETETEALVLNGNNDIVV